MAFELGFLVGSLALLALVVYYTRIRGPSIPRSAAEGQTNGADGADGTPRSDSPETEVCDICERERVCTTEGDLTICAECNDDLLA